MHGTDNASRIWHHLSDEITMNDYEYTENEAVS